MRSPARACLVWLLALPTAAVADPAVEALLDRARAVETKSIGVLLDHFRVEADLLAPDTERLSVFFTEPRGAAVESVTLALDGKRVAAESFAPPRNGGEQARTRPLLLQGVAPGDYRLSVEVQLAQGGVLRETLRVVKEQRARFVEIGLDGTPPRRIVAQQW